MFHKFIEVLQVVVVVECVCVCERKLCICLLLVSENLPIDKTVDTFGNIFGILIFGISGPKVSSTRCHLSGCNKIAATSIFNAIAPIISIHPRTSYVFNRKLINGGYMIGPIPANVIAMPDALFRFLVKYELSANENDELLRP